MKHILVPIDFSKDSLVAARLAAAVARAQRAEVTLFHVVDRLVHTSIPPRVAQAELDDMKASATAELEQVATALQDGGDSVPVHVLCRAGAAVSGILRARDDTKADIIVMGTHGDAAQRMFQIGSVALRVARDARCPVLVTREPHGAKIPKHGRFNSPLVAIDYSKFSRPAVALASQLAVQAATIELLNVIYAPDKSGPELEQALNDARTQAVERLQEFAAALDVAPIAVRALTQTGRIARQILEYVDSSPTDLVVIGAHGRDESIAIIGTVADRILRHSSVPVVLLPEAVTLPPTP